MNKVNVLNIAAKFISEFESFRSSAYKDQKGIWTLGYGTIRIDSRALTFTDTCTKEQAIDWLQKRIEEDFNSLDPFFKFHDIELTDNQFAAILSFTYNAGLQSFMTSSMAKDLLSNDDNVKEEVANDLLKWCKIRVGENLVFSQGLYNRRIKEGDLFKSNEKEVIA